MIRYIFRAYMIQSAVMAILSFLLFEYLCINEKLHPSPHIAFDGPIPILLCLYFEIILVPINTLCLTLLKNIQCNIIKIETNKSIIVFTILCLLVWLVNVGIFAVYYSTISLWIFHLIVYLLIIIGIVALNYIVVAFKHLQGKRAKTQKEKR